jgi:glycosyltransferase involved in cell wall biosynthesis
MKLSIITINYNNAAGLKKTLDSVAIQTCTDFEHIVVDGASADESVEIIREYENTLASNLSPLTSHLTWLSEPDTGIYNAMNKGVRLAKGEYTLMLNSGDYLVDEHIVENVLPILDGTDIIQGNTISVINNKEIINRGYAKSDISFIDVYKGIFLHQATFSKRILFEKYGYFDESYKIGGDTVFFLRTLGFGNASFAYRDINVAYYDGDGISTNHTPYWNKQRALEDQMYDELLPHRLLRLCKEDGYKINVYNQISSYRFLKKCMMLLLKIANILDKDAK